jgi:DNA double-strand break repair helicase HerA and related ATPase
VQHALRAFSPLEQKAVKAAATTFRANPAFDTEKAIMELAVGEALVSTLDDKGQPTFVQRTLVHPPNSRVGPVTDVERKAIIAEGPVAGVYEELVDRESAFEILQKRDTAEAKAAKADERGAATKSSGGSRSASPGTTFLNSIIRSAVPVAARVLESALKNYTKRR